MGKFYEIKSMSPQFRVVDLERALTFYTEILEFNVDFRYEDFYAGISKNGFSIHLKLYTAIVTEKTGKQAQDDLDVVFSVHDIEALYQQLSDTHSTIVQPLRQMPYGKEFYISDPDGHVIGFLG